MAVAVEAVVGSAGDVDGIDETIFAEGVGKVPKCFLVAGGDVVKPIAYAANGSAFYFSVQIETVGDGAVADKNELPEETAAVFLNVVFHLVASGDADDLVAVEHGHIAQAMCVALPFFAIDNKRAEVFAVRFVVGRTAIKEDGGVGSVGFGELDGGP